MQKEDNLFSQSISSLYKIRESLHILSMSYKAVHVQIFCWHCSIHELHDTSKQSNCLPCLPSKHKHAFCTFEPPHDKTNKMACAPSKKPRPAWASTQSDQPWLCAQLVAKDPRFLHTKSEDFDQTGWMPRLICVFAGRICHFVGFVMRPLICDILSKSFNQCETAEKKVHKTQSIQNKI